MNTLEKYPNLYLNTHPVFLYEIRDLLDKFFCLDILQ
jgi:hypothetical protein